ncbi:ATP-binding cassette sub-family A member 3-like, partial [Contarinia nasturtii]|uniref:ATP-binding cassette sub-family A member 3-like n=1 Tax=Contarinia nasturtii TaxID=265458 RepID=UPI0012D47157
MKLRDWALYIAQKRFSNNNKDNSSRNDLCSDDDTRNGTHEHRDSRRGINTFDKFRLLMWKNILLQRRHKLQTIIQILMPILFTSNLVFMRSLVEPVITKNSTMYNSISLDTISIRNTTVFTTDPLKEWQLVYYPKNDILEKLLNQVSQNLELDGVVGVKRSNLVERMMIGREMLAGVIFNHPANITELPKNLVYTLRFPSELRATIDANPLVYNWQTNLLYPIFSGGGPRGGISDSGGAPSYHSEGFLAIQNAIAQVYMQMNLIGSNGENGYELPDKIEMQRFPYPPYVHDVLLDGFEKATGIFIMLSFVYPIISTVRFIAVEKEKQLKEIMKIMGMPVWLHWTSWFVRTMIFMLISITFMVALLKIPMFELSIAVFTHSNWFTIWVFLFVYSIATITFCFMLSVLCSKANTAAAAAGLMWFISYVPFIFLSKDHVRVPRIIEMIACLSPNMAMAYGCKIIVDMERSGFGLQWYNFWGLNGCKNELTVGITMCCMLISALVFLLIALYIEKLYPGEYGVPEKWYFPFKTEFWTDKCIPIQDIYNDRLDSTTHSSSENFEAEPTNCVAGVRVKNLRKIFDHGKVACKNVTINMFCDQITVLLGHNGAGKSTTIKMLTGMIPPTSGTAIINGYDIRTDLKKARESIGICPQHNILFDELTVREHIEIYSRLKGLNWDVVDKEIMKYVRLLSLESKIDTPSKALSGGMKRKLAFGIALCGDSKVVLCDEPTSGVDPSARRELWDLIQREKFGRTIILTTHFMDEADVLGDRIAIMADGEVKCCGTPFFLKKRFGSGYRLTCVTKQGCESSEVTKVLQEYIPEVEIRKEIVGELSYSLSDEHTDKFGRMFERIENDLNALKIDRFGVSSTELEEVFLKVGSDHKTMNKNEDKETICDASGSDLEFSESDLLHGLRLRINQCYAMFKKRYYCWINDFYSFLGQNVIVVIFIAISLACVHMAKNFTILSKLEMSLDVYGDTVTMLQTPSGKNTFKRVIEQYRNDLRDGLDEFSEDIQKHFLDLGAQIRIRSNTRYLIGLSTGDDNSSLNAWFNDQLFHTAPLALNVLHNAILRANFGNDYSIKVSNWPISYRPESLELLIGNGDDMGTQLAVNMTFVMAFISAFYVMFHIREKASKAKLLQFISGIDVSTFWILSFVFDYATHIVTCFIACFTMYVFEENGWSTVEELTPFFIILTIFALSSLAVTFVSSFLFSTTSYGFVSLTIIFIFTGNSFFNLINILSLPALNLTETANMLKSIFLIFPHYALGYSLFNLNQLKIESEVCRLKFEQMISNDAFRPEISPLNFTSLENNTRLSDQNLWKNSTIPHDPITFSRPSCD